MANTTAGTATCPTTETFNGGCQLIGGSCNPSAHAKRTTSITCDAIILELLAMLKDQRT